MNAGCWVTGLEWTGLDWRLTGNEVKEAQERSSTNDPSSLTHLLRPSETNVCMSERMDFVMNNSKGTGRGAAAAAG